MGTFVGEWFGAADAFLLGRKTYEIFAAYWPNVTDENDPVASKMNAMSCPIRQASDLPRSNS